MLVQKSKVPIREHLLRYSYGESYKIDFQGNVRPDNWYVFFVVTGEEDKVKERLQYKLRDREGLRIIVPKRSLRERKNGIWKTKVRTLFPGYVIVNGYIGVEEYYLFKRIPGLIRVLRDKSDLLEIDSSEITVIKSLISEDETIGNSRVIIQGSRVVVVDGPLKGLEGLIESVDKRKGRAKVRVNFMGELKMVDLSISIVEMD